MGQAVLMRDMPEIALGPAPGKLPCSPTPHVTDKFPQGQYFYYVFTLAV
jgi:hypothetical protein